MPKKNAASSPVDPAAYDTLLEVLISWTEVQPKKHLYGFLEPQEVGVRTPSTIEGLGVRVVENLNYESVLLKVKALAYQMKHEWHLKPKDRVILCFPPGTDFLVAFLGCLWAGVIAVPVPAPSSNSYAQSSHQRPDSLIGYVKVQAMFQSVRQRV